MTQLPAASLYAPATFAVPRRALLPTVIGLLLAGASVAQAQTQPVTGRVVDADSGRAIAGASVEVLGTYWRAATAAGGGIALELPPARWRLRVSHIGYAPDTVVVTVGENAAPEPFLVQLRQDAVQLKGLSVTAADRPALAQSVTPATVRQVPPLGEPDVFRALVLLPGVSQPNDLKGRIHLAGGASDETGILLDGHPMDDPFHLFGLLGAFNVATVDRADVLINHLPASEGGDLSGLIQLQTRRPGEDRRVELRAGLLSSGLTASLPDLPAGVDVLAAGRVAYLDRLVRLAGSLTGAFDDTPRYGFRDALLRVGRSWDGGWRADAIGFTTRDRTSENELTRYPGYEPLSWGESLAGLSVRRTGRIWSLRLRGSFDRATTHLDERPTPRSNFLDNRRDRWSARVEIERRSERWRVQAGVVADGRHHAQRWQAPGFADEAFSPNMPEFHSDTARQTVAAAFAELSTVLGSGWTAVAGGRVSHLGDDVYPAPRVLLRFDPEAPWRVELAADRRFQFDAQLEEPVEGSVAPPMFLLQRPRIADVVAGVATWAPPTLPFGLHGDFRIEAFAKRYRDRTLLPDPEPGQRRAGRPDFPAFRRITGRSTGASVQARLAFGDDGAFQGNYTYQQVREDLPDGTFPARWDAPHSVSLFASVPVFGDWTFNAVYRAHSGHAVTPVRARVFVPVATHVGHIRGRFLLGERNSIRVPPYRRLDLGLRRAWRAVGADWSVSFQVLNVFFGANPIDYDWQQYYAGLDDGTGGGGKQGLPIVPSITLGAVW